MTVWRVRLSTGGVARQDVLLDASPAVTIADVTGSLRGLGLPTGSVSMHGVALRQEASLFDVGLVHGDVIDLVGDAISPPKRAPGRYVVAVSGPQAGRWWPLPPSGRLDMGRDRQAAIHVEDSLVSGRHCRLSDAGGAGVTVEDLGSSNGTLLEGNRLVEARTMPLGSYVQVGSTVLTVLEVLSDELPVEARATDGARSFQRHFRPALEALPERIEPPTPPADSNRGGGRSWWQYLLPLASGAGMAAFTGRWQFLLIMAIAPIAMLVQFLRKQKQNALDEETEQAEHEVAVAAHAAEVARVRAIETQRRRRAAVGGGEALLIAELRHRRVWERSPGDEDHGEVCIGLASQPSMVEATAERGARDKLWGVPLSVSLPMTGSVLVRGAMGRARAVGRSMLMNLAATHSPLEMNISVLTHEDQERDWSWVRWLPHSFADRGAARIFVTADQRDSAMTALMQQIEAREEAEATMPLHVVLIDGAAAVPTGRLTALLSRGVDVGIHGIVLDERITPEGVRATLTLGSQPDEGTFSSRDIAQVDGILTAELNPIWAERAAMSLAGLRPASDDADGGTAAEVHLTDLVANDKVTVEWVREAWKRPPSEQVVVGLAGSTRVSMDIVRHGPHAIVGGATRSGKTEFLLTWLTSMCLANTTDDLAIMVADFKGGVDHVQTAKLPHTISLVTNQDIRAFERTLVMLEAEIERRQDVLAAAGTSNIEAYRTARLRDDSKMAVPRLLVVVDEFSELRQADRDSGAGYMHRLESVARVGAGLGVHLILVTQNFSGGQLSDQIDGQVGLGVCFRVEKAEHSKVVLRSPVATTVPASRPGRGWARLRGLDLAEFQSARVAGRRRDLQTDVAEVRVELVPFGAIAGASITTAPANVPHDETDLARVIEVVNEAAAGQRPPIPWPEELRTDLRLAEVVGLASSEGGTCVGMADLPHGQRQTSVELTDADEQLLVLGSSASDCNDALLTIAAADALSAGVEQRHIYAIDLEGTGLAPLGSLPHVGAVACLDEDLSLRIIRRLSAEAGRRRGLFEVQGVADLQEYERVVGALPRVRLIVNGADRLAASSEGDASPLMRPLSALAAEAAGTGVQLALAGGAALVGRKMAQRATRRFVMQLTDSSAYAIVGVKRDRAIDLAGRGRAWDVFGDRLVQLGGLLADGASAGEVVEALGAELTARLDDVAAAVGPEALPEVRWPLPWARVDLASVRVPAGYGDAIPVGVDTDTGRWRWIDAEEDGPVVAVAGAARSGRSTALLVIGRLAMQLGWDVQAVAPTRRSGLHALSANEVPVSADPAALVPAASRPTVYLVDDVNRFEDGAGILKVLEESDAPILIFLAGPIDALSKRMGSLRGTPEPRVALTLAPTVTTTVGNARIPDHLRGEPRAGRGAMLAAGEFSGLQIPQP